MQASHQLEHPEAKLYGISSSQKTELAFISNLLTSSRGKGRQAKSVGFHDCWKLNGPAVVDELDSMRIREVHREPTCRDLWQHGG